jgi:hypothetical protein
MVVVVLYVNERRERRNKRKWGGETPENDYVLSFSSLLWGKK